MRECETFIPSLDIVAVDTDADDKIVGSSMCVKSHIKGDDGCKTEGMYLFLRNNILSAIQIICGIKMQKRFEQLAGKVRPAVLK